MASVGRTLPAGTRWLALYLLYECQLQSPEEILFGKSKMLCCQSVWHKNRQRKVLKQKKSRGSEKGSNNERTEA